MTPSSRLLAVVITAVLMAPAVARADDAAGKGYRIFGQLTSYLERNLAEDEDDPEDVDYTKFKQLGSFNIEWGKLTIGAELEYLYWSVPFEERDRLDLDRHREGFDLRKYYLDYQSRIFQGRLGTFYSSFGRGLTLYVQRNEALGFDEPVHGATARLSLEHFDITALGGRVTEPVLQSQTGIDDDEIMGGRAIARLPFDLYLGGSVVRADLVPLGPADSTEVEVWSAEAGGSGLFGVLDLAAEWSEIEKTEATRVREGHGRYFSAGAYFGPVSILAEYKDYYNFDYRYNLPPNAGSATEQYQHKDVKGPRLLVSADIVATGSLIHASYAAFNTHKRPTSPGGTACDGIVEWYGGLEQTVGRVYFEASYFDRRYTDLGIDETHTVADFHLQVGRRGEIIASYDQRLEEADYFRFETTRTNLGYSLSPWGTVSLRYAWEDRSGRGRDDFWGLEVQYLPTPKLVLTVFGGGEPGGLVCAGGQCRIEPRFKGAKANVTWRF